MEILLDVVLDVALPGVVVLALELQVKLRYVWVPFALNMLLLRELVALFDLSFLQ